MVKKVVMKIDVKLLTDKENWLRLTHKLKNKFRSVGRWVLTGHSHALDIMAAVLVLLLGLYLVLTLLYLEPPGTVEQPANTLDLSTDLIDRLELWIEQWDAELSSGMSVPDGIL